jgi:POT family proton-dependent oligopeptide transporter
MPSAAGRPVAAPALAPYDDSFFGHPRGLSTLFFTEMWERFSYYGMRALLILFMTAAPAAGGLGFDTPTAGAVYGLYTSMVYLTTLPGGWVADRLIGAQRAVLYGGVLIAAGHFSMAVPSLATFYLGLLLIVLGTGLLKGNVSVIVGRLYSLEDARRDAGYSIFYMGINTGAFIAPLVCGYLGQRVDWHIGFGAAGVGMTIGLVQYMFGRRLLGDAGLAPADAGSPHAQRRQRTQATRWTAIVVALLAVFAAGAYTGLLPVTARQVADAAGYLLLGLTVTFLGWMFFSPGYTRAERKRMYVIVVLFLAAALFWSEFEQAGSTLNLFADRATNNAIFGYRFPSSWYQALNSMFIITLAPVFAWMWIRLGRRGKEPSSAMKFGGGLVLVGAGFAVLAGAATLAGRGVMVSPWWLVAVYFLHTCGELALSPVGMSAMTKLAPMRIGGLIMGFWFLALSAGNYIGGRIAGLYETWTLPALFAAVATFGIAAGLVMFLIARPVTRLEHGGA